MSVEVMIIPMLFDLAVITASLIAENRKAGLTIRNDERLLTKEELDEMRLEAEQYRRQGHEVRESMATGDGTAVIIHTDEGYNLGIRRNRDGAYEIVSHWEKQPGRAQMEQVRSDVEERIKQKYAYEKVKRELARKGYTLAKEEVQADNTIRLVARKW